MSLLKLTDESSLLKNLAERKRYVCILFPFHLLPEHCCIVKNTAEPHEIPGAIFLFNGAESANGFRELCWLGFRLKISPERKTLQSGDSIFLAKLTDSGVSFERFTIYVA